MASTCSVAAGRLKRTYINWAVYNKGDPYRSYVNEGSSYRVAWRLTRLGAAFNFPCVLPTVDKYMTDPVSLQGKSVNTIVPDMYANLVRLSTPHVAIDLGSITTDFQKTIKFMIDQEAKLSPVKVKPSKLEVIDTEKLEYCPQNDDGHIEYKRFLQPTTGDVPDRGLHWFGPSQTHPAQFLRSTVTCSPALTSLFVAVSVIKKQNDNSSLVLLPSYISQPLVNTRSLSDVTRLTGPAADGKSVLGTATGETNNSLVTHPIVAMAYCVRAEKLMDDQSSIGKVDHAMLHPMVKVDFQQQNSATQLCDAPVATNLNIKDVKSLWYHLFNEEIMDETRVIEESVANREMALIRFADLMERLDREYHGLGTLLDWTKLYVNLRKEVNRKQKDIDETCLPRTSNELYHQCRLMLQSLTRIRVGLLDGLCRVSSAMYALLGRYPELSMSELVDRLPLNRAIPFQNLIYKKTGERVTLQLVDFSVNSNSESKAALSPSVMKRYKDYSKYIQDSFNNATTPAFTDCLVRIVEMFQILNKEKGRKQPLLQPGEFNPVTGNSVELKRNFAWSYELRTKVIKELHGYIESIPQVGSVCPQSWKTKTAEECYKIAVDKDYFGDKNCVYLQQTIKEPRRLVCVLMLLSQFQFCCYEGESESMRILDDFVRFNGRGKNHCRPEATMRGLFPDSRDGVHVYRFDLPYLWMIHYPQILLCNVGFRKLGITSGDVNLRARYAMAGGTALLELYNMLGPVMEPTGEAQKMLPSLHAKMIVNPYTEVGKDDSFGGTEGYNWYDTIGERPGVEIMLWSNIPTFISILCWMAIRSEDNTGRVPEKEKLFYIHRLPARKFFQFETGKSKRKNNGTLVKLSDTNGNVRFPLQSWRQLTPKFVWRKQNFDGDDNEEIFKGGLFGEGLAADDEVIQGEKSGDITDEVLPVEPLDLLQMADLFYNDESVHWKEVLGPNHTPEARAEKRAVIDAICAKYIFEVHFFNVYKEGKKWSSYTEIYEANKKKAGQDSKLLDLYLMGHYDQQLVDENGKDSGVTRITSLRAKPKSKTKAKAVPKDTEMTPASTSGIATSNKGGRNAEDGDYVPSPGTGNKMVARTLDLAPQEPMKTIGEAFFATYQYPPTTPVPVPTVDPVLAATTAAAAPAAATAAPPSAAAATAAAAAPASDGDHGDPASDPDENPDEPSNFDELREESRGAYLRASQSQKNYLTVQDVEYIKATKSNPTANVTRCLTDMAEASLEKTLRFYFLAEASKEWSHAKIQQFEDFNKSLVDDPGKKELEVAYKKDKATIFDGLGQLRSVEKQLQKTALIGEKDQDKRDTIYDTPNPPIGKFFGDKAKYRLGCYAMDYVRHWSTVIKTPSATTEDPDLDRFGKLLLKSGKDIARLQSDGDVTQLGMQKKKLREKTSWDTKAMNPLPELEDKIIYESTDFEDSPDKSGVSPSRNSSTKKRKRTTTAEETPESTAAPKSGSRSSIRNKKK